MIIWLASYPKSGNTLLRSLLGTYFYSPDGNFNFEYVYKIKQFPSLENFEGMNIDMSNNKEVFNNFINAQKKINLENKHIKFLKTHSGLVKVGDTNFTDLKNTLGAIYVVRDPRNVVSSFAYHYSMTIDEAANAMVDKARFLIKTPRTPKTFLGSWEIHYNSWKQLELNKKYLLIKYEDLINKKKTTLIRIFKFFNTLGVGEFKIDMIKLNKVIKSTEFQKMKNLEKSQPFQESMTDPNTGKKIPFFNLGPNNNWTRILPTQIRKKIEKVFEKEMIELGYL